MGEEEYEQDFSNNQPNPLNYQHNDNADLVRLALNNQDILEELRIKIAGLEWDDRKQKYCNRKGIKPLLDEKGLYPLMSLASSTMTRNTTLSRLKDEKAIEMAREVESAVNDNLLLHYGKNLDDFDSSNWQIINIMFGNATMFAFNRAIDGSEMNILGGGTKTMIQKQEVTGKQTVVDGSRKWGVFK